jgi:hypothetical protein
MHDCTIINNCIQWLTDFVTQWKVETFYQGHIKFSRVIKTTSFLMEQTITYGHQKIGWGRLTFLSMAELHSDDIYTVSPRIVMLSAWACDVLCLACHQLWSCCINLCTFYTLFSLERWEYRMLYIDGHKLLQVCRVKSRAVLTHSSKPYRSAFILDVTSYRSLSAV